MRNLNKSLTVVITLVLSSLLVFANPALAAFDVEAESAILMEADTGQVLFTKNVNEELPPASITKVMTLLLAMEAVDSGQISLNDMVITSEFASSMGGSQIYLSHKEKMKVKTLLESIAIASANDACVAIGEYVGGTEESFVDMMNKKADELGLKHTHFTNSTGLPTNKGDHYSSAHDIAIMSRELINNHPKVLDWTNIWIDEIRNGEFTLYNTNGLINYYPGADGLKTGWTDEAGYSLSATAKRDGMRLISVVMKTKSKEARIEESAKLLSYGFSRFDVKKVVKQGEKVGEIEIKQGQKLKAKVEAVEDLKVVLHSSDKDLERKIKLDKEVVAPIKKGEVVGKLIVKQNDENLRSVDLAAAEDVKQASLLTKLWRAIKDFVLGFFG
ncbi:D-alanyl-D-alanine carboxypeptidase family protein [Sporohalobacter salinus]|uniref:D-alanyl-D-alanine carboxypeptidase family protein n=1 Tax=Sporohalobacter salinus TaxID=1494606 RepID=UPI001960192D|nr:D-alanyl-D-alanine carboxypeptidase family protein [Sporohalobacter salinus]MBM7623886.1 D-alanyl-D-alanine carboxypeptidase (penicillin-binding protein 5/6) [Sporohalobacter salinus]